MTSLDCVRAGGWMTAAEAGRIDEADALRLETHLASCESCQVSRTRLGGIAALLRDAPGPEVAAAGLERALSRALVARTAERPAVAKGRAWMGLAAAAVALGAVVVGVGVWRLSRSVAPREVVAREETTVRVPGVRVEVEAGSRARIGPREVVLHSGRVRVSVHPGTPFEVRTDGFVASVHGTTFAVAPDAVEVWSGRVIVRSRAGAALADLTAGEEWPRAERTVARAAVDRPAAVAQAASPEPVPVVRRAPESVPAPTIADVRRALRERRTEDARGLIGAMVATAGGERAELELLRADSLKLDRRFEEAAGAYHAVADRWPRSATGQSALFEAVQIEAERMPARARRSVDEYRRRYPEGTFAEEVEALSRRIP